MVFHDGQLHVERTHKFYLHWKRKRQFCPLVISKNDFYPRRMELHLICKMDSSPAIASGEHPANLKFERTTFAF